MFFKEILIILFKILIFLQRVPDFVVCVFTSVPEMLANLVIDNLFLLVLVLTLSSARKELVFVLPNQPASCHYVLPLA